MTRSGLLLALVASLLSSVLVSSETLALMQSGVTSSTTLSVSTWATSVNSATGIASNSPYVITWTANTRRQYALISLINTGSIDLSSGSISFTSVKSNGDITNPPTLTFELCSGVWNTTTFACSGSISSLVTAAGGDVAINQSISIGNRIIIRITNLRDSSANYLTTIDALASRANFRSGIVFSS